MNLPPEDGVLTEDHLRTLESACRLFDATKPEDGSSIARQLATTRRVIAALRGAARLGMTAQVLVRTSSRSKRSCGSRTRRCTARAARSTGGSLRCSASCRANVDDLQRGMNAVMRLYEKYSPFGDVRPK